MAKVDRRPICTCPAYRFPHRVGGRCDGSAFAEYYFYHVLELCHGCNCNGMNGCEVIGGQESIKEAECYAEACHRSPGQRLPLEPEYPEDYEDTDL